MKNKRLYLIAMCTMLFMSAPVLADDSGVYMDPHRDGEGMVLVRNLDYVVAYLFTYGHEECIERLGPKVSPPGPDIECNLNGQRWFMISGDELDKSGNFLTGKLYATEGLAFPFGIPDKDDPFQDNVGEADVVGVYIMQRVGDGWEFIARPFGDLLDDHDYIFFRTFLFSENIFPANA